MVSRAELERAFRIEKTQVIDSSRRTRREKTGSGPGIVTKIGTVTSGSAACESVAFSTAATYQQRSV
jgi:hypothetical protein